MAEIKDMQKLQDALTGIQRTTLKILGGLDRTERTEYLRVKIIHCKDACELMGLVNEVMLLILDEP